MSWLADRNATSPAAAIAPAGARLGCDSASSSAASASAGWITTSQPAAPPAEPAERSRRARLVEQRRPEEFQRVGQAHVGGQPDQRQRHPALGQPEAEGEAGQRQRQAGEGAEGAHQPQPRVGQQGARGGVALGRIDGAHGCVPAACRGPRQQALARPPFSFWRSIVGGRGSPAWPGLTRPRRESPGGPGRDGTVRRSGGTAQFPGKTRRAGRAALAVDAPGAGHATDR